MIRSNKMFDCKQDIGLLYGSLLSAAHTNSDNLFDCVKIKDAVRIVYGSIKMIIHHSLKAAKDEKEKINIQLHCNERLHATLFFTTLRSHGIRSQAADEFYNSILYNWPSINLKFYVELNFKCDWSEYFVMCALQLPSETLLNVLKMISEIPFESDIECYASHLVMQTLIYKLFQVSYDKEVHYPFNFDFVVESAMSLKQKSHDEFSEKNCEANKGCDIINDESHKIIKNGDKIDYKCDDGIDKSNTVSDSGNETLVKENNDSSQIFRKVTELDDEDTEEEDEYLKPFSYEISDNDDEITKTENEDLTLFKELCSDMYHNIALILEKSNEIGAFKILLHAVKIISRFLKNGLKIGDTNILSFENYFKLLKDYLSSDINQQKIKTELKECSAIFTRHAYATVSWNVCLNYVIFLLGHYIDETYPSVLFCESLDGGDLLFKSYIPDIHSLYSLNYPFLMSDGHIALLCKVIKFEFEGSSYAANILLSSTAILKKKNVLATLEENCHVINLSQSYFLIVDHIISADYPELKQSLLKILYTCLQMNKLDVCNSVIGYIITNYGFTEEFQLPDYNDLLSKFAYQTPNQEEIEKKIPAMLVQNPKSTLKYLIDETLLQGPEGEIFIQILKHFPNACIYMTKSGLVCILHEILNDYFKKPKLEALFSKNMATLYRFLAQVHSEAPILLPCDFFSECIIPKLHPDYDKIGLVLDCTSVLLPALLSDDYFLKDSEVFYNLIVKFGLLANYFIVKGNGEMKSLTLSILKDLVLHQKKNKQINEKQKLALWSTFKNFEKMTCVYFEDFLPEDIELLSRSAIWIRCCKNEDLSNFEENFSVANLTYTSLVNTLVEVLPHLTRKEWSYCFSLVKMCCANNKVQDEITCSNNLFQLCGSDLCTYAAVLTIITSVHFVLNDNIDGSLYVSSCVSNFLKDAIFQEENINPHFLLSVALEICHLISSIPPNVIHIYHGTLLELKKELCSHSLESGENDYSKLLDCAITCLPNVYQDKNME